MAGNFPERPRVCVCVCIYIYIYIYIYILRVLVLMYVRSEIQLLTDFHKITFEDAIKDHTTLVFFTW
jgi:hypothetical protein